MENQERISWEEMFMTLVYLASMRSRDTSTHSGCVITTKDNVILSTGYNSFPRNIEIDADGKRMSKEHGEKYYWVEHAERNAIYNAVRSGVSLKDATLYVNWMPCADCARGIIQSGITEVVVHKEGQSFYEKVGSGNWKKDHSRVYTMLAEAGVVYKMCSIKIVKVEGLFSSQKLEF